MSQRPALPTIKKSKELTSLRWHERLQRSGYLVGAILLHLILFVMLASWVIFRPPQPSPEASFRATTIKLPPPPAPPPPTGGTAANALEPDISVTPPTSMPQVLASPLNSNFSLPSMKAPASNLAISPKPPTGSDLAGVKASGLKLGAGNPFGIPEGRGAGLLEGYLYDLKQSSSGQRMPISPSVFHAKVIEFLASGWNPSVLTPYYKSPHALYASSIFIPTLNAKDGPKSFGVEKNVLPKMYLVWYKAEVTPPRSGTYRFVGIADDILVVAVNGQTVLDGALAATAPAVRKKQTVYSLLNFLPTCSANRGLWVGVPFDVQVGESVKLDILIGEQPGGHSNYFLYLQRDGAYYTKQANGVPLLPVFQLDPNPIQPVGAPQSFPPFSSTIESWKGTLD